MNKVACTLPPDRLAAPVAADNVMRDGDRVEPPWICHADGTCSPLFVSIEHQGNRALRIREARLDDLRGAEMLYARCVDHAVAAWARVEELNAPLQSVGGIAHARATHDGGRWWRWYVVAGAAWPAHEWTDAPTPPQNLDLGQRIYDRYWYAYSTAARYRGRARAWLVAATRKRIAADGCFASLLRVTINGHHYLWKMTRQSVAEPYRFHGDPEGDVYAEVEW